MSVCTYVCIQYFMKIIFHQLQIITFRTFNYLFCQMMHRLSAIYVLGTLTFTRWRAFIITRFQCSAMRPKHIVIDWN